MYKYLHFDVTMLVNAILRQMNPLRKTVEDVPPRLNQNYQRAIIKHVNLCGVCHAQPMHPGTLFVNDKVAEFQATRWTQISRVSRGPTRSSCTQRPETPRFGVLSGITKQFRSRSVHSLASTDVHLAIRPLLERLWPLFPKINLLTCNTCTKRAPKRLANTHWRINISSDASCGEWRGILFVTTIICSICNLLHCF